MLLTVLSVLIIIACASFWAFSYTMRAETNVRYVGTATLVSEKLSKTIRGMEMNARNVFDEVGKHLDTPESVMAALESKSTLNPDVKGYFAAFRLDYFKEKGRWFEPYIHRSDAQGYEMSQVGSARHDYTKSSWYIQAEKEMTSFWSEPYYYYDGTSISGHYCTFVQPIVDKEGEIVCVCGADITLEWLSSELAKIDEDIKADELFNQYRLQRDLEFYTVVIDDDGSCIVHPDGKNVPIKDKAVLKAMEQRKSGVFHMDVAGERSFIYYAPIAEIDWSVAVVGPANDAKQPVRYMCIALLVLVLVGSLVVWFVLGRYAKKS